MKSCIYKGQVRHRRFSQSHHEFSYNLFMMFLDLDKLPSLFERYWLWSFNRTNLASFKRDDHIGEPSQSLKETAQALVKQHTGKTHNGRVFLLTHLRYFGFVFNPVSFYYCYGEDNKTLEYVICEVSNTPWNERHVYVLDCENAEDNSLVYVFNQEKQFHVSPFMPMDIDYRWHFSNPADDLNVHMANHQNGEKVFDATLRLSQLPINSRNLALMLVSFPLMTMRIVFLIYFEAFRLWLKKVPFIPHPNRDKLTGESKV